MAARLGIGLRDARVRAGRTQEVCAAIARISQARWSDLERGRGANAPLETWAVAASAAGQELAAFLDQAPGADLPRDIEHLRRQSALVERATAGGWAVAPEMPVTVGESGRVIDALLTRAALREAAVFEVWDLLLDVGGAFRSLDEKVAAVRARLQGWTVSGAWVIRGTRRNRSLVAELAPLFRARFPAAGADWLRALDSEAAPMPREAALLWTDATGANLGEARPRGRSLARPPNGGGPARPPNGGGPARPANGGGPARPANGGGPAQAPNGGGPAQAPNGRSLARPPNGGGPAQARAHLTDPRSRRHHDLIRCLGGPFDPDEFSVEEANARFDLLA